MKVAGKKACVGRGVPQRPSNPAFLRQELFLLLPCLRQDIITSWNFFFFWGGGGEVWYLECRPLIANNHAFKSKRSRVQDAKLLCSRLKTLKTSQFWKQGQDHSDKIGKEAPVADRGSNQPCNLQITERRKANFTESNVTVNILEGKAFLLQSLTND